MAKQTFILAAGIQAAKALTFRLPKELESAQKGTFNVPAIQEDDIISRSLLGTPVFAQVEVQGGNFFELSDVDKLNPIPYEGMIMQNVLLEVSQSRNIITTAIQGRNGTVKEFISDGDFSITMTGNIVGFSDVTNNKMIDIGNTYPLIDTNRLIEICKIPDSFTVTSDFLQRFGINQVVITDYSFAEKLGTRNEQPFQISMLSDVAINLEELDV